MEHKHYSVIIIGGGLAGLCAAIALSKAGISVLLAEKKTFPYHKVCGEYVSNEVKNYLKYLGLDISKIGSKQLNQFQLSAPSGRACSSKLDMGGFGISRYRLDETLYKIAVTSGTTIVQNTEIEQVAFEKNNFTIYTKSETFTADYVLGAYGKRSRLDKSLQRPFMEAKSPYMAVKYHIRYPKQPKNLISLHNFKDGYCGISAIEDDLYCLCYLSHRNSLKKWTTIAAMEKGLLSQNPFLKDIFENAEFVYEKPLVINEISFETKASVEQHMLMLGDAAGLITPLNGNGMAMAIRAAKMASDLVRKAVNGQISREELEKQYSLEWKKEFAFRLWQGRQLQKLFGNKTLSEWIVKFLASFDFILKKIIKNTHGNELLP